MRIYLFNLIQLSCTVLSYLSEYNKEYDTNESRQDLLGCHKTLSLLTPTLALQRTRTRELHEPHCVLNFNFWDLIYMLTYYII